MNKVREGIQRKIRDIEGKKAEIEGARDKLKDENNHLQNRKCYIFVIGGINVVILRINIC